MSQTFTSDLRQAQFDPFIKAHGVEENDNNAIDQVCIMLADIADEFDVAIDLVSHAIKGPQPPVTRDRGASSKRDAHHCVAHRAGEARAVDLNDLKPVSVRVHRMRHRGLVDEHQFDALTSGDRQWWDSRVLDDVI
jgi:hypothetical protein